MFERMTDRARRVIVLAQDNARALGHNYIGTEHLLLGVIDEGGTGARTLESLGVLTTLLRDMVVKKFPAADRVITGHIPFTPRAKKALELSLREALQLGHSYVGTEHLLLGVIRLNEGTAAGLLAGLGVDIDAARKAVIGTLEPGADGIDKRLDQIILLLREIQDLLRRR